MEDNKIQGVKRKYIYKEQFKAVLLYEIVDGDAVGQDVIDKIPTHKLGYNIAGRLNDARHLAYYDGLGKKGL